MYSKLEDSNVAGGANFKKNFFQSGKMFSNYKKPNAKDVELNKNRLPKSTIYHKPKEQFS